MSNETITLALSEREVSGKKVKNLRKQGIVPVVIYEKGKDSINGSAPILDIERMYKSAGKHHAVELTIGKSKKLAFVKDVTVDPVKHIYTHVAFHAVKLNEKVEAEVPLKLVGTAPAQVAGLMVRLVTDSVVVKGLPSDIPNEFEIDITGINTEDDDIRANAINPPAGIELINVDPDQVIVSVVVPRAEVEKAEEEESTDAADVPSEHGGDSSENNSSEE